MEIDRKQSNAESVSRRAGLILLTTAFAWTLLLVAACTTQSSPTAPAVGTPVLVASAAHAGHDTTPGNDDHGYIDGWFEGETVQLHYTKSFFCEEPPASGATTDCEIGAPAEVPPRGGPIPIIYAIAAAGIAPDPATLACRAGTLCLDHPGMIDASRVGGSPTGGPVPHSHIISEHRGGWFQTVNIRVRSLDAWNQIAAAKTLEKVRELQADPNFGGRGLVSADTPTNIFFFIASFQK
jgi:hypothetical protein